MAKKSNPRKQLRANARKTPAPIEIKVQLEATPDVPVYYANYVEVGHSPHEFALNVARVPTKIGAERLAEITKSGIISLSPEVQLLLPPTVIPSLIFALQKQLALYETNFGKIRTGEKEDDR